MDYMIMFAIQVEKKKLNFHSTLDLTIQKKSVSWCYQCNKTLVEDRTLTVHDVSYDLMISIVVLAGFPTYLAVYFSTKLIEDFIGITN